MRIHEWYSCKRKKLKWSTRGKAVKHASFMRRTYGDKLYPYFCRYCNHWHIGHRPKVVRTPKSYQRERNEKAR